MPPHCCEVKDMKWPDSYSPALPFPKDEPRKRREALGLSATALAQMIGTSPNWVLRMEKDPDKLISALYFLVKRYLRALKLEEPLV